MHITEIQNFTKNKDLQNALITHGVKSDSDFQKYLNYARNSLSADIRNSTEQRIAIYSSEIDEFAYPDDSFMSYAINDAQFAATGEVKKMQSSVEGMKAIKGRLYDKALVNEEEVTAQKVYTRKNTKWEWVIEYFRTPAQVITMELTSEVGYNALLDLLRSKAAKLMEAISNFTLVEWSQGAVGVGEIVSISEGTDFFVMTSGTAVRKNPVTGTTGNVKKVTLQDFKNLKSKLELQRANKLFSGDLVYLPTEAQIHDIRSIDGFFDYNQTGYRGERDKGLIGDLYGFKILDPRRRDDWGANILYSQSVSGDNITLTKVEDGADAAANMLSAGIAWYSDAVKIAKGKPVVFPDMNNPQFYGDLYSSETRHGAIKARQDGKGVVMLVEAPE